MARQMRRGDAEGLGTVYDDEGRLIFQQGERMYGRRGFSMALETAAGPLRKEGWPPAQWLVYYTNVRVVGLRDMTAQENTYYLGTLRPFERARYEGEGAFEHHVLKFLEFPLEEVVRAERRRHDVRLHVQDESARYVLTLEPFGAAARFFARLITEKGEGE
jgi:hypothetical protein